MKIKALILAGGRSQRFGADKAMALLHGSPLIAHVLAGLTPLPVAIAGGVDGARFAFLGAPILPDPSAWAGQGPLAGLAAARAWAADADVLISVPCDTPLLPTGLAGRLLPGPSFARAGGRDHPLIAAWPTPALARLPAYLRSHGSRRVADFARHVGAVAIDCGADGGAFANVNFPDDLLRVQRAEQR